MADRCHCRARREIRKRQTSQRPCQKYVMHFPLISPLSLAKSFRLFIGYGPRVVKRERIGEWLQQTMYQALRVPSEELYAASAMINIIQGNNVLDDVITLLNENVIITYGICD